MYAMYNYGKFLFVSEFSRMKFARMFPHQSAGIVSAVSHPRIPVPAKLRPRNPKAKKYAVIIVSNEPRKNVAAAIEAAAEFDRNISLWIMGDMNSSRKDMKAAIRRRPNIRELGYVSETQKRAIIRDALCVIVPAFSEGFGLPIAEAFAEGTPVACSESELFRE